MGCFSPACIVLWKVFTELLVSQFVSLTLGWSHYQDETVVTLIWQQLWLRHCLPPTFLIELSSGIQKKQWAEQGWMLSCFTVCDGRVFFCFSFQRRWTLLKLKLRSTHKPGCWFLTCCSQENWFQQTLIFSPNSDFFHVFFWFREHSKTS